LGLCTAYTNAYINTKHSTRATYTSAAHTNANAYAKPSANAAHTSPTYASTISQSNAAY
jgi:hypothetical protein